MANARGKAVDNTHLSIDQASRRGFIHRDYLAHCLRWTHVSKFLREKHRYKDAVILDVGCGRDLPLARMLHTDRLSPKCYIGVDYNKLDKLNVYDHNFGDKPFYYYGGISFPDGVDLGNGLNEDMLQIAGTGDQFEAPNIITSFEVLEHVEPEHARRIVTQIANIAVINNADIFISTPNWDPKVGAADNHVNEMTYEAVGYLLESSGLEIIGHWGTFASQKDYKLPDFCVQRGWSGIGQEATCLHELWNELSSYYDSNYLSTIFAPLFPAQARNCLWHCKVATEESEEPYFPVPSTETQFTSSEKWKELLLEDDR